MLHARRASGVVWLFRPNRAQKTPETAPKAPKTPQNDPKIRKTSLFDAKTPIIKHQLSGLKGEIRGQ
ncbi:MAG: hypothetical protein GX803_07910 [Lentisphaerae bacterium]|jgi:hypothetical protein|nr:hypothetical protein [Lentisphaerota bacterium]